MQVESGTARFAVFPSPPAFGAIATRSTDSTPPFEKPATVQRSRAGHWDSFARLGQHRPGSKETWRPLSRFSGTAASRRQRGTMPTWICHEPKRTLCSLDDAIVGVSQMVSGPPSLRYLAANSFGTSFREENVALAGSSEPLFRGA